MRYSWWIFQALGLLASVFFLLFGTDLMIGAYSLNDPFSFIMTFFSASFVLLISLTLAISFLIKIVRVYRSTRRPMDKRRP